VSAELRHSGLLALTGRPNVGKSALLNRIVGSKVSIVSDKPQTTRREIRGILNRPGTQAVFLDAPGLHKPRGGFGERMNEVAARAAGGVDVVVMVLDATAAVGSGDRFVARSTPADSVLALNKVDAASPYQLSAQLQAAAELGKAGCFLVSALTGQGVADLVEAVVARLPGGSPLYPGGAVTDMRDEDWVADLVRERLLAVTRDELPHAITCRVTEWDWPRIRCEILVQRESQKGIVIGRKGAVLKEVGTLVRQQLPEGAFVELAVKVDKGWQRRSLESLGY
jgi:GTP-binding protein Era